MSRKKFKSIVHYANSRGSRAQTREGARRFLLKHLPQPIPGLLRLKTGGTHYAKPCTGDRSQFGSTSHELRATRRAAAMAAELASDPDAFFRIPAATSRLTHDMQEHVERQLRYILENKIEHRLMERWPFRRATSNYVGGEHSIEVKITSHAECESGSEIVWPKRRLKWRGRNSFAYLSITQRAVIALGVNLTFEGKLCIDVEQLSARETRYIFVTQSVGFELKLQQIYVIKGVPITALDVHEARAKVARLVRRLCVAFAACDRSCVIGPCANSGSQSRIVALLAIAMKVLWRSAGSTVVSCATAVSEWTCSWRSEVARGLIQRSGRRGREQAYSVR